MDETLRLSIEGADGAPLSGNAKQWLYACARAQRLALDAGVGEWDPEGLDISAKIIQGDPIERWIPFFFEDPQGLEASSFPHGGENIPPPEPRYIPPATSGSIGTIELSTQAMALDPQKGLLASCPDSWDIQQLCQFIALHEMGHAAHLKTAAGMDRLGLPADGIAEPAAQAFLLAGTLSPGTSKLGTLSAELFGECFADCFAAICLGGQSPEGVLAKAQEIRSMREATQSSHGDTQDWAHDTRLAMDALAEWAKRRSVEGLGTPHGKELFSVCMECASHGTLGWILKSGSSRQGLSSFMVWREGKEGSNSKLAGPISESAISNFESFIQAANEHACLAQAAKDCEQTPMEIRPARAFTLLTLARCAQHLESRGFEIAGEAFELRSTRQPRIKTR